MPTDPSPVEKLAGKVIALTRRASIYAQALREIRDMAARSDAHPDLDMGKVASDALRKANDLTVEGSRG